MNAHRTAAPAASWLAGISATVGCLLLAGCGGGGGGGVGGVATPTNLAPQAAISSSLADGITPLSVDFDGTASTDPDGRIVSYSWNFGDGSAVQTGARVSHDFTSPGGYNVRLTVTDDDGATATSLLNVRARGATLSGSIAILSSSAVDRDVNDRLTFTSTNNDFQNAQPIPNPVRLGGYVNLPGTGEPSGNLFQDGDPADVFAVSLAGGELIRLAIGDTAADLDLELYDANQQFVDASRSTSASESLVVANGGDYFVRVLPFAGPVNIAGASNYVLSIGQDLTVTSRGPSRVSDDFAPGEVLINTDHPASHAQLARRFALAEGGLAGRIARARVTSRTATIVAGIRHAAVAAARQSGDQLPNLSAMTSRQRLKYQTLTTIKTLAAEPGVVSAEPNVLMRPLLEPNDEFYGLQWHYRGIRLPAAWDLTTGTATGPDDVIVAVVDTGILPTHPDLAGKLVSGYDFISDPGRARDGNGIDPDPTDQGDLAFGGASSFHGSHVAGTIAAESNNAEGVAGVSWGARLMPLRALGVDGGASFDVIQAVRFAAGLSNASGQFPPRRADIINLSLGSSFSSQAEQTTFNEVRAAGVIVIASAGNTSSFAPTYPAAYSGVVSVSATTINEALAPYSNFGASINLAAPGGFNGTDLNGDGIGDGVISTLGDDSSGGPLLLGYGALNGTSMAAPHVAGVAALMKAVHPGLTPDEFDMALVAGDLTDDRGPAGRDDFYGHGLINAQKAVLTALSLAGGAGADPGPVLGSSESVLNFGVLAAALPVTLTNVGTGSISIASVTPSEPWVSIMPPADVNGLGTYTVNVDRTGLTEGTFNAGIVFEPVDPAVNSVTVSVSVQVAGASPDADAGLHYVILVDPAGNTVGDPALVTAANGSYAFSLTDVPAGSYRIVAGSDMDDDAFLCDAGEACGAYRTLDAPEFFPVDPQIDPTVTGLDFVSEFRAVIATPAEAGSPAEAGAPAIAGAPGGASPLPPEGLRIAQPVKP